MFLQEKFYYYGKSQILDPVFYSIRKLKNLPQQLLIETTQIVARKNEIKVNL